MRTVRLVHIRNHINIAFERGRLPRLHNYRKVVHQNIRRIYKTCPYCGYSTER